MARLRDHEPLTIEEFNGWWKRGDADSCPLDHFPDAENIQYIESGFETRDGLQVLTPGLGKILRIYNYLTTEDMTLLILDEDGNIYHRVDEDTIHGPILTISGMEDFNFVAFNGRAYITPFVTVYTSAPLDGVDGLPNQVGMEDEFLYVYLGDGTPARKAAGSPPTNPGTPLAAALSGSGLTDIGLHIFAVIYETNTGFLTAPGPEVFAVLDLNGTQKIDITDIPEFTEPFQVKKHIVSTKAISGYNGDQAGYQFFFIPGATIVGAGTMTTVEFFDNQLLKDASHLIDNFSEIPAGVGISTYHNRLTLTTPFEFPSVVYVSYPGEPEAISQIDGLLQLPLDINYLTNIQEFRDNLYVFKQTQTFGYSDNGDVPSSWAQVVIDQGIGASVHGIGTVLDSGGVNIDYLQIVDRSGIMLFNGTFIRPELTWKIGDFWLDLDRLVFNNIQICNDSLGQILYITLPNKEMLIGDYKNGLNAKDIRWAKWRFDIETTTIALYVTNILVIGSQRLVGES